MKLLILTHAEIEQLLPMRACIEVMAEALTALARGDVHQPQRMIVRPPDAKGLLALMPVHRAGSSPIFGLKTMRRPSPRPSDRRSAAVSQRRNRLVGTPQTIRSAFLPNPPRRSSSCVR